MGNRKIKEMRDITKEIANKYGLELIPVHVFIEGLGCSCKNLSCKSPGKHPVVKEWKSFKFDSSVSEFVCRKDGTKDLVNLGIKTGGKLVVLDFDSNDAYNEFVKNYPLLKNTLTAQTSKGYHCYFLKNDNDIISNKVRFKIDIDLRGDGGFVVAPGSVHFTGKVYEWINPEDEILRLPNSFVDLLKNDSPKSSTNSRTVVPEGGRNDFLFREAMLLISLGMGLDAIKSILLAINERVCDPPLDLEEIEQIFFSAVSTNERNKVGPVFDDEKMYGVIGDIVNKISSETEAASIAIYTQMLTTLGCYFGRIASLRISGDRLYPNLMTLIIGDSAIGRKGTALGVSTAILKKVIPDFVDNNLRSGLTSAEGLIYHNRDPVFKNVTEKSGNTKRICVDEGVADKRMLAIETEFGSVLLSMKREGNKLSAVLRDVYDSKNLGSMSKSEPVKSTNPHISLISHITIEELMRLLDGVDISNGFANRFTMIYSETHKIIPNAKSVDDLGLEDLVKQLQEKVRFATSLLNNPMELNFKFSPEAELYWMEIYSLDRKNARKGMVGGLLNRNLTHMLKFSLIFTLLDGDIVIEKKHLEAAHEITEFAKKTTEFVFKDHKYMVTPRARKIITHLEQKISGKASRSEISKEVLSRNSSKSEIDEAKKELLENDLVTISKDEFGREVWASNSEVSSSLVVDS